MKKRQNRYRVDKALRRKRILSMIRAVFGALFSMVAVILMSAALAHAYFALLDSPWLKVEEIQIIGLKKVPHSDILNTVGVAKDTSILVLKIPQLTARLESLPSLRAATVRLDGPGRLVVEVVEREPLVIIAAEAHYLLDSDGKLYARTTPEQHPGMLVVNGFSGTGLKEGKVLSTDTVQAITTLLAALQTAKGWLPMDQISECTWNGEAGFSIRIGQNAMRVQLGSDHLDEKFKRLQEIQKILAERQLLGAVTRVDLDYGHRAYVEGHFPPFKGI
ncbi:MAG: FtsQ-type POTRA domain-containing protein [Syntrophobacteraceae bacterium]|nr:FtsQ-type POTRA domain-containing protein [Syntrophobacteraceae bacterium]